MDHDKVEEGVALPLCCEETADGWWRAMFILLSGDRRGIGVGLAWMTGQA